jgi:hypothetical protein
VPISADQLRTALRELNGQRDLRVEFEHADTCMIARALLVPAEKDNLVKVTDGSRIYLLDAERIAWMEIG